MSRIMAPLQSGDERLPEASALPAGALCWRCEPELFDFTTTDDLKESAEIIGQERALDAIRFGVEMRHPGYNLYVLGPPGAGKRTIVQRILEERAAAGPTPPDWCYVHNFDDGHAPCALSLPAGRGAQLRAAMDDLIDNLRTAIPAALASEEHKNRLQEIAQEAKERHDRAVQALAEKALAQGIQLVRTPGGFALAPLRNGEIIGPEEYEKLSAEERQQIERTVAALEKELQSVVGQIPTLQKQVHDRTKELNREAARLAIGHLVSNVKRQFADLPRIIKHLDAVEQHVIEHANEFHAPDEPPTTIFGVPLQENGLFDRYVVNLLVDNGGVRGAPVVAEDHPTYQNLLGRVEHEPHMGTLVTDFTLITPGALHRANGGYLIVEAVRLLLQPFAWEALKRALQSRRLRIESLGESLSLISTVSLEPEPIPFDVKVVLLGDRLLFYLLYQFDHDFAELFKVAADFEDEIERTPENCRLLARLIAALTHRENRLPLDRSAMARVLEHAARVAGDAERLTTHLRTLADLLREADYWATQQAAPAVSAAHVELAIEKQIYRADRIREHVQEEIQRGLLLIDTEGARIAQVNGLSVLDLGNFAFGRPSRITATVRLGKGEVIDIEREVELGGAIHSKGVLILASFLASRYARNLPLSLTASLVFEQSYGMVEGDSASVAELCALLSALAEAPIAQSLAVTGSVNQLGQVQPIGGVNEKIEGFFDVCRARGLTGQQGVLIPAANVKHLMLRRDVVEAAAAGKFHVYPIGTIDQAIARLTGLPAGQRDSSGAYPPNTINHRVEARLLEFSQLRQKFAEQPLTQMAHER